MNPIIENMASEVLNRYIWLVELLNRTGPITLKEINRHWERSQYYDLQSIPMKTFQNHRKRIQEIFGIEIKCNRSFNEYSIEDMSEIHNGNLQRWLINSIAVSNIVQESRMLKNRVQFENIPSGQQYLSPIIEAMRDSHRLEITYQNFWSDEPKTITLEPYFVKVFRQRLYVIGKTDQIKTYALDRIKHLESTTSSFHFPEDFDPEAYFFNCFGIIRDEEDTATTIRIKAYHPQERYLRALPLHHSQREIEVKDDYSVFEWTLQPTYDFKQELLAKGDEIEALEPEWFRKEFGEVIDKIYSFYEYEK